MTLKNVRCPKVSVVRAVVLVCTFTLLAACQPSRTRTPVVPVTPMCTILCEVSSTSVISWNGRVFVSDRTDPAVGHNFAAFRAMSRPLGNPDIGFTNPTGVPDTYGISEAWMHWPGAPEVYRAQATPAFRTTVATPDVWGSAWNIRVQDQSGAWSDVLFRGTANRGDEGDAPEVGAITVPRFMPVGLANLEMFACAGSRTQDNAERTTWLIAVTAPNTARGTQGSIRYIQDLLSGDDRWLPPSGRPPLSGTAPPRRPTPPVSGPGNPIRTGSVMCGMTQLDDDVTTRELHMLAIDGGRLYHSMASNFGPFTDEWGFTPNRFRTVSPWGDVGQALGGGFGNVISAAIVAHPAAVSVFFMADSGGGRYRLWHAVRFSSGGGSWRPARDVLALSGDAANGTVYPFHVSAGICPEFGAAVWNAQSTETLVALSQGPDPLGVSVLRVTSTPRQWRAGVNGVYSPMQNIPSGAMTGPFILRNVVITARPFRDDATPSP